MPQNALVAFGKANYEITTINLLASRIETPFRKELAIPPDSRSSWATTAAGRKGAEINGTLYSVECNYPDGQVMCFQSSWKRSGASVCDGAIFVRLRATAAKIQIAATLPPENSNNIGTLFRVFSGNADLLSLDDLQALGIDPGERFVNTFMVDEEVDDAYVVSLLEPAVSAPPIVEQVKTASGKTKLVEVAPLKRRRMMFKRDIP